MSQCKVRHVNVEIIDLSPYETAFVMLHYLLDNSFFADQTSNFLYLCLFLNLRERNFYLDLR